ncbi:SRPBCC domain-containing protein [Nonomuraea aridisoli]|uniref:SRPBCC domain-containing protein n=1 Tax=Nonomuraea aridisoli TaxID=2070368 RepID=A0A2W2EK58_9ACTN|nr:SRPBCC domain-containing protein [Nonomuraea aridisoli]PZG17125.1 SRPBCC domain-containing protein [Nonomuraea aridisoli]
MRQIRTEIHISATPEQVWAILVDFTAYPEWNPLTPGLRGEPVPGSRLTLPTALIPGISLTVPMRATVEEATPPRRLAWRSDVIAPGVASSLHDFELTPDEDGTHLLHRETVTGALAPMMWPMVSRFAPLFDRLNQKLKERAEAPR